MNYGRNSSLATMRLIMMTTFVERETTEEQREFLAETGQTFSINEIQMAKITADYEARVLELQESSKEFYFGDGAFPKELVETAVDAIENLDLRLQVAYHMMKLLTRGGREHTAKELAFVETAIDRWGIREPWEELVAAFEEEQEKGGGLHCIADFA